MIRFFHLLLILVMITIGLPTYGQKSFQPKQVGDEWKGIVYRNEHTGDVTMHTNGLSFAYNKGKIKTYYKTTYYHVEFGWLFDPREQKQNRNIPVSFNKVSQSFKFGKQNSMYVLRVGKGVRKLISDKAKRKGVAIGYNYEIGPSLAILRPYYLELLYNVEQEGQIFTQIRTEKYSEQNAAKFLDFNSVFGGATGSRGWSEISIIPGIQAKLGTFFSLGAFEEYAKSLEVGIMADIYIRKVPIMVETEAISAKPYFVNFYATFQFGKRSN